jgi:hypothetical protein
VTSIKRIALPAILALAGLWLLVGGCIYIPGHDKVVNNEVDPRASVGNARSGKPLSVASATRDDVYRVLGLPHEVSDDGRTWTYRWNATNGVWFMPLCFAADPAMKRYAVRLSFREDGRLSGFKVSGAVQGVTLFRDQWPGSWNRVSPAATRPTTQAAAR